MSLTSAERQALKSRTHGLAVRIILGRAGLTPAILQNVRDALTRSDLVKVRMKLPEDDVNAITARIVAEVPCELVGRTGFNSVFYLRTDAAGSEEK